MSDQNKAQTKDSVSLGILKKGARRWSLRHEKCRQLRRTSKPGKVRVNVCPLQAHVPPRGEGGAVTSWLVLYLGVCAATCWMWLLRSTSRGRETINCSMCSESNYFVVTSIAVHSGLETSKIIGNLWRGTRAPGDSCTCTGTVIL